MRVKAMLTIGLVVLCTPLAAPAASAGTLYRGADAIASRAVSVVEVQRLLNLTVDPATFGPIPVDGVFGPRTKAKLTVFQRCAGLPATGGIDAETVAALWFWAESGTYVC